MAAMWHTQKHYAKLQSMRTTFTVKKLAAAAVLMLIFIIKATLQYTCTSTSSTEIYYIGYKNSFTLSAIKKIVEGPISGNFYYLFQGSNISNVQMTTIAKLEIHYWNQSYEIILTFYSSILIDW